jgi:DNA polymerase III psi subunit
MSNDPELIGRMCKKISQLTRVIYLLNTRNDESDSLIKSILKSYDFELENFRKEANEVIKIKSKLEKSKETSLYDNKIKDIKKIMMIHVLYEFSG